MKISQFYGLDIVLLCGLYGAGKTEFSKQYFKNRDFYRVSRLEIRRLLFEMTRFGKMWKADEFSEENDSLVKHVERKVVEHYIHHNHSVLLINTFVTEKSRARFLSFAKERRKTIGAIFIDTPLEQCVAQNDESKSRVPARVIYDLSVRKQLPSKQEGFDLVAVLHDYTPPKPEPEDPDAIEVPDFE